MTLTKNEKTKRNITDCAKKLFAKHGYINTSMRQISARMGYKNQAALYYYFQHKKFIGREISNSYHNKLSKFLLSLPAVQEEEIVFLPLREVCNCHLILMDPKALAFMIEVDSDSIFTIRESPDDLYFKSILSLMKSRNESVTTTDVKIALSYYVAGFLRILKEWDAEKFEVSYENFVMRIPSVLLRLLHFDETEINTMVEKAKTIYDSFSEKDLTRLKLF